ncbi:hypothetical protein [Pedobacter sp. MC2016-24]|uniref:hypothetical protein n=1 Tax=Pedobacter sp. MC2016-24 TaxID=2780090 RepID=UPI001882CA13|nr:hypothetical protein [Pedobacter sp. MC2016-24]MBE9599518.1 hypothetical protein [Pedobacter sp. MC2016-24]
MNSATRVVKNTGILYARMAITIFISLYTTRLILNGLGVNDFGIFNLVAGAISMLTFLNTAMASATQRFMSYAEGAGDFLKTKSIFNVSIILHIIIGFFVLLVLEIAGYFLFNGVLNIPEARMGVAKLIFQFMIVSTLFSIVSVPYDAVINAHENMLLFALLGILEAVCKLFIAIYICYTEFDRLVSYGLLIAVLSVVLLLIRRIYCKNKYPECELNLKKYFDRAVFKEMTGFAGWSFLGSSSSMISNYGQGIVLNIFFGPIVNAAQGVAGQVSGQLSVFAGTMLKALNPLIDKSEGAGNRKLMLKVSIMGGKVSFFLLMLFFVPVLIEMPYIFKFWLKNVPQYVVIFCRLLLIRNLIEQLFVTLASSISAEGNIRRYQIFASILCFFPLVISYGLFKFGFPPYALYIVFIVYSIMASALILYFSNKNLGLSISHFVGNVLLRCISSFFMVLAIASVPLFFMQDGILRLLIVLILSSVSFIVCVWFIGFSNLERENLRAIIKGIFQKLINKSKFLKKD